jgi:hypothetical protein
MWMNWFFNIQEMIVSNLNCFKVNAIGKLKGLYVYKNALMPVADNWSKPDEGKGSSCL